MTHHLVPIEPALLALLRGSFGPDGALRPFVREITLIESHVAGTSYRDLDEVEPTLQPGALLVLQREPSNSHDPRAIRILDDQGHFLGYVPRIKNEALANLMDAGKLLFGRLEAKTWQGSWLKLDSRILLRDQ